MFKENVVIVFWCDFYGLVYLCWEIKINEFVEVEVGEEVNYFMKLCFDMDNIYVNWYFICYLILFIFCGFLVLYCYFWYIFRCYNYIVINWYNKLVKCYK